MQDIQDRLDAYLDLTPDARRAVAAEVESQRPELLPALREAEALAAAFEVMVGRGSQPNEALAHLAARDHLEGHTHPEARPEHFAADADLRHAFFALRDRVETLDRELSDPLEQFQALTGHRLEDLEPRVHRLHPPKPAPARGPVPRARVYPLRARLVQYGVAACFGLAALYGALAIASRSSISELDWLGALDPTALAVEGFGGTIRGGAGEAAESNDARYLDALETLGQARQTTLGLFPHYDEARLQQARRQLEGIVVSEERGSFLQLEASFVLGKTLLLMEQEETAALHFTRVVEFGGRHAEDAARILASLEARAMTEN